MYIKTKRVADIILTTIAFLLLLPIFLVIALIIKIDSPGPILFQQKRVGINKSTFNILKFRTMRLETPKEIPTHLLPNVGSFITRSGHFLRKTSLDELPQILNILKGDMSIIGPRPALWNQYDLIAEREKYNANGILPGLTGWAQINGRDELPIEIKAKLDGEYIQKQCLKFDLLILTKTLPTVMKSEGIRDGK